MGRVFKPRRKLSNGGIWTSPKWYIEYRDAGGVQYRKPASTSKAEALGLLKEVEGAERRRALGLDPAPIPASKVNLQSLVGLYLEEAQIRLKPSTHRDYTDSLSELVLGEGAKKKFAQKPQSLRDLNLTWAQRFQTHSIHSSAPRTINKKLRAVCQFLNWVVTREILSHNPLQHLRMLPQRPQKESRALTGSEAQGLIRSSSGQARSVWTIFLETGMRKGELASLEWNQIDFKRRLITINGKKSKNHRSRVIPMTKEVHRILKGMWERSSQAMNDLVFPKIEGRSCFYSGCLDVFKRYCSKLGIKGVNIHSLRRTFTVRMLEAGVSPAVVQRILGHSTANLTLEVYAKVNTDDLLRAITLL